MILKQFYLSCLAHASYLIGDTQTATAAVVDPQRDTDQYIAFAAEHGLTIKHVFLTHLHADFVAGHLELRDRVAAKIYLGAAAKAGYAFTSMHEGDTVEFGRVRLRILETAVLIGSDELGRASRALLLRSMYARKAPFDHPVKILAFGKEAHDKEIIGAAYYTIMCNGRKWWACHDGLDPVDKSRLEQGMMRCAKEWQDIQTKWATDGFGCHLNCAPGRDLFHASLKIQAEKGIAWYDIIGKVNATLWSNSCHEHSDCRSQIGKTVRSVSNRVKSELYDYFAETI